MKEQLPPPGPPGAGAWARCVLKKLHEKSAFVEGCTVWTGSQDREGFGVFIVGKQRYRAHRAAWILHHGAIPKGKLVLHHCSRRHCIEPAHLYLATYDDLAEKTYGHLWKIA